MSGTGTGTGTGTGEGSGPAFAYSSRRCGPTRLELLVSVLNVFSDEQVTDVCERVRGCGEFELGEPTRWGTPRQWEVGFRLTF